MEGSVFMENKRAQRMGESFPRHTVTPSAAVAALLMLLHPDLGDRALVAAILEDAGRVVYP